MSDSQSRSSAIKTLIPKLGLKEYWYPAILARKVKGRPVGVRMLGETLVLFRAKDGRVAAASNTCPHRGGSLMHGVCHYRGTVACPYHGWVFDEAGECVAVLSEGPESAMPGKARLRIYPTAEYKGLVFVWMGKGEPVPIGNEIPPEFFEGRETALFISARQWDVNWRVALENSLDSHVMYVHRNAVLQLMEPYQQFGRTGYSPRIVDGRAGGRLSEGQAAHGAGILSRGERLLAQDRVAQAVALDLRLAQRAHPECAAVPRGQRGMGHAQQGGRPICALGRASFAEHVPLRFRRADVHPVLRSHRRGHDAGLLHPRGAARDAGRPGAARGLLSPVPQTGRSTSTSRPRTTG